MRLALILALASAPLLLQGCATRGYVERQTVASEERLNGRIDGVITEVEHTQTDIQEVEERTTRNEEEVVEVSKTAQDALDRAVEAGKLAEGKFLYETVLTDDEVKFGFDQADLNEEARTALGAFAEGVKSRNEDVYIEIQGHTDSIGPEDYNQKLGLERAEAVRRHLSQDQGFALHRISVISYGESEPVVDNDSRENRGKNRRVALVVLR